LKIKMILIFDSYKKKHKDEKSANAFSNSNLTIKNFKNLNVSYTNNFEIKNEDDHENFSDSEPDSSRAFNRVYYCKKDINKSLETEVLPCFEKSRNINANTTYAENDKSTLVLLKNKNEENNKFNMQSSLISNVNRTQKGNKNEIFNTPNCKKRRSVNSIILRRKVKCNSPRKLRKKMHCHSLSPRKYNSKSYVEKSYIKNSFKIKNFFYSYKKEDNKINFIRDSINFNEVYNLNNNNPFLDYNHNHHPKTKIRFVNNNSGSNNSNNNFFKIPSYSSRTFYANYLNSFTAAQKKNANQNSIIINKINPNNKSMNKHYNNYNHHKIHQNSNSSSNSPLLLSKNFCRICKEDDNEPENNLISICNCRGLMQYTHIRCSSKYIRDMNIFKENSYTCEICQKRFLYVIDKKYEWRALKHSLKFVRFVVKFITLVVIDAFIKYLFPVLGFLIVDEFVNNIIFWTIIFLIVSLVYFYSGLLGFDILETWTFFDNSALKDFQQQKVCFLGNMEEVKKGYNKQEDNKLIKEDFGDGKIKLAKDFDKINFNNNDNERNTIRELDDYDIISPERKQMKKCYFKNDKDYSDKLFDENARTQEKTAASASMRKSKSASPNKQVFSY